jgi:TetR/AcrR family transcriptional regulator
MSATLRSPTVQADGATSGKRVREGSTNKTRIQAEREQLILDAAEPVFAELGFQGATIEQIARDARISKPNLIYYFKTKRGLYEAVLKRTLDTWLRPLQKLDSKGDPIKELSAYIREKVSMSEKWPSSSRVYAHEMLSGAPFLKSYMETELRNLVKDKSRVIKQWIAGGKLADVDPMLLIFLIWAYTQHFADFLPQVKAILNVQKLERTHYDQISGFLCHIVAFGLLPRPSTELSSRRDTVARKRRR